MLCPAGVSALSQPFRLGSLSAPAGLQPNRLWRHSQPCTSESRSQLHGKPLYSRKHGGSRRAILLASRIQCTHLRHCRKSQSRYARRSRLRRLGPLTAKVHFADRADPPPIPCRVLQRSQSHEPANAERSRLHNRSHSRHTHQPNRTRSSEPHRRRHHRSLHQPSDPTRHQVSLLTNFRNNLSFEEMNFGFPRFYFMVEVRPWAHGQESAAWKFSAYTVGLVV